jgi:hypothetical protein
MNIKRTLAVVGIAGGVALGLGTVMPAGADTGPETAAETTGCSFGHWPADVQGRPVQLAAGATAGLYLWHDDHGWHAFVTHENHDPVVFRITVRSASNIFGVETHDESGDAVIEHADNHAVTLRATNWGYLDGMNFRTACGAGIEVSGTIDGVPLDANHVWIGHDGDRPPQVPFRIGRVS